MGSICVIDGNILAKKEMEQEELIAPCTKLPLDGDGKLRLDIHCTARCRMK